MQNKKKKKQWVRLRHRIIRNIANCTLGVYTRIKYRVKVEPFKEQGDRKYLILMNHQTAFDQFFVGMAFKGATYYVANEDLFNNGFVSKLLKWAVAPIPIKKQRTDVSAVRTCMRVVKEGGTIAIAPEGNRTFSGKTEYMNPAIVGFARVLKLPLAFFRIEGGYGVHPRWADDVRKGKMRAYVSRVVEYEDYAKLSDEELFALIQAELSVDEGVADAAFKHKRLAQYLERAYYVCPDCGLSEFKSERDTITCQKCGKTVRYLPTKELQGLGFDFPFRFTTEWYEYQKDFIRGIDLTAYHDQPLYSEKIGLWEVIPSKSRKLVEKNGVVTLYGDRLTIKENGRERTLDFKDIQAAAVLGRNKLNLYYGDTVYQLKGDKRWNALKYVHIYYHYKNAEKGENDGEFLGL